MASQIPLVKARLLAIFLECITYGVFTAFFGATVYFLLSPRRRINILLLITVIFMFMIATAHLIVILTAAFDAFDGPSALQYYRNVANPHEVAQGALLETQIVLGDFFMIYRCYIVWDRKWYIVVIPVLSIIGMASSGYVAVAALTWTVHGDAVSASVVRPWMTATAVLSAFTNIFCSVLIAFKLYAAQNILRAVSRTYYRVRSASYSAVIIIVESAALYSAALAIFLIVYLSESNGQYVLLDALPSIVGINFTAIVIRITFGLSSFAGFPTDFSEASRQVTTIGGSRRRVGDEVELHTKTQPVEIHVDHLVEVEGAHDDSESQKRPGS